MSDAVVHAHHLSFAYGHDVVLQDVNFTIQRGEFVGLIGPNGGGKTTLLKLILGFLRPKQGEIAVFGEHPNEVNAKMAYVPQGLRFDRQFPISVMELVLGGRLGRLPWYGMYSKEDRQAAKDALEKVHLTPLSDHPFGTLSGGQAQRALIARALVSEPELLLLDEPTASVDPQAEQDIYRILDELRNKMTLLMVTHDLQVAVDRVDRVLCVQGSVTSLLPEQVCEHFALGLYHAPLQITSRKS